MIKEKLFLGATIILLSAAMPAQAALVTASTSAYLTFRDCVSSGTTVCDTATRTTLSTIGGLPGDTSTTVSQGASSRSITAEATLLPEGAAHLESRTRSTDRTRDSANAMSLQRYTYTGTGPATLAFQATMNYVQTVPNANADFPQNAFTRSGAFGRIRVFSIADAEIDAGSTNVDNFSLLYFDYQFLTGYTDLGWDYFQSDGITGSGSRGMTVLFNVNSGDTVWLYSLLLAPAVNGADVWASLDSVLTVPEPGTLALAALCLAGLAASRRRSSTKL